MIETKKSGIFPGINSSLSPKKREKANCSSFYTNFTIDFLQLTYPENGAMVTIHSSRKRRDEEIGACLEALCGNRVSPAEKRKAPLGALFLQPGGKPVFHREPGDMC